MNPPALNPVAVPVIPDHAPFTKEQISWLNGYLAGLYSWRTQGGAASLQNPAAPASTKVAVCIGFGSQGGTAEGLAKKIGKQLGSDGHPVTVLDMSRMDEATLKKTGHLLLITSTYGQGEPPDNIKGFHQFITSAPPIGLTGLSYSVFGLGDTQYAKFCQCAKDLDAAFERHGAVRLHPRVDCDVDFEKPCKNWLAAVKPLLMGEASTATPLPTANLEVDSALETGPGKENPFSGKLLMSRRLSGPGSSKEIRQVVLSTRGQVEYQAGDALGVFPENDPALVEEVLSVTGWKAESPVTGIGETALPLRQVLLRSREIARVPRNWGERFQSRARKDAASVPEGSDLVEALQWVGKDLPSPQEVVEALRGLSPRLYSISSSPKAHPGEVHLTVGAVRYDLRGRKRSGVASVFLAERAVEGETLVPMYAHSNSGFRLPEDSRTPVIMIGPGTGIAPFRAFMEERKVTGAKGPMWLFFGDQHMADDFIYREEIESYRESGVLSRLDLAFSRDQKEKIYVQHRMTERAGELMAWIEEGAHLYVCGDAARMAKDVEEALAQVVMKGREWSREKADAFLRTLQTQKRYLRDVY